VDEQKRLRRRGVDVRRTNHDELMFPGHAAPGVRREDQLAIVGLADLARADFTPGVARVGRFDVFRQLAAGVQRRRRDRETESEQQAGHACIIGTSSA
jgi:hypothetical protein